jgi:hypothetical protein
MMFVPEILTCFSSIKRCSGVCGVVWHGGNPLRMTRKWRHSRRLLERRVFGLPVLRSEVLPWMPQRFTLDYGLQAIPA